MITRPRILLSATLSAVLLMAGLMGTVNAPQASAATVSTNTIVCNSTTPGDTTLTTALAAGDGLTLNYNNCNNYTLTWTGFSATFGSSPFSENGNNTEARALTNYSGSTTSGTVLATLSNGSRTFRFIQPSAAWTAKTPVAGVVGSAYNSTGYQFTAAAGGTYSVASGSLPSGLSLSTSGLLSGTPTRIGTFTFAVAASNEASTTGNVSVTITGPVISKVTICHRTRATTNPYVMITVSVNSVIGSGGGNGHSDHNTTRTNSTNPTTNGIAPGSGPFDTSFTYPSNRKWWGDIIPPFTYSTGTYSGLNWGPDWNTPDPTTTSATDWLQPAEFAAAVSSTSNVYRNAVLQCMDLTGTPGAQSAKSAQVDTPDKYFSVAVDNGEDPDSVREDLVEQEALDGSSNTPRTIPSVSTLETNHAATAAVRTDAATSVTGTTATLNGTLQSGSTWTTWTYEWGTSTSDIRNGLGSSYTYVSGTDPASSIGAGPRTPTHALTGLTCGTTYYFRVIGTNNASLTTYGGFLSFQTSSCGGGGGGGNGGNGGSGNGNGSTATPTPTPSTSSSAKPLGKDRVPTKFVPPAQPSPRPSASSTSSTGVKPVSDTRPSSSPRPNSSPSAAEKTVTLNPATTTPAPPGDPWVPEKSRLVDPKSNTPTTKVQDAQGTWNLSPVTGAVTFTPAPGFTGTAKLNVQLSSRTGALYIEPVTVQVGARSRVLLISGDVPMSISAGKARKPSRR